MKTGLITIHDTVNYGSLLQTIGLYRALQELNVDVELIDYKNEAISARESTCPLNECRGIKDYLKWLLFHHALQTQKDNYWLFLRKHVSLSAPYDRNTIKSCNKDYHSFIIGSDIVWSMEITGHDMTYMLDFAEDSKRKYAFSASVGTKWKTEDEIDIKNLLSRFEHISVREHQASTWICELLNKKAPVTCDPTMLWPGEYWRELCRKVHKPKRKYVLIYMPDKTTIQDARNYAKNKGLDLFFMNFYTPVWGVKSVKPLYVEDWLALIENADTLFTSSYHGLLFSLYFHTNVFYYNRAYSARMKSLSEEMNLGHREATENNIYENIPIDFGYVDKILAQKRNCSWDVLSSYFK